MGIIFIYTDISCIQSLCEVKIDNSTKASQQNRSKIGVGIKSQEIMITTLDFLVKQWLTFVKTTRGIVDHDSSSSPILYLISLGP